MAYKWSNLVKNGIPLTDNLLDDERRNEEENSSINKAPSASENAGQGDGNRRGDKGDIARAQKDVLQQEPKARSRP